MGKKIGTSNSQKKKYKSSIHVKKLLHFTINQRSENIKCNEIFFIYHIDKIEKNENNHDPVFAWSWEMELSRSCKEYT